MSTSGSKNAIIAALFGNLLVACTKFFAGAITGSSAMFSEGVHSVVDTGNQGLLLLGMKCAQKEPDARFPFGHGKEIYFWSFIVAILIFALGAGISFYEGIHTIYHPKEIESAFVNYVVLVLAVIFEGGSFSIAYKEFVKIKGKKGYIEAVKGSKDPSLFVVLFEDFAAMLGLVIALLGVFFAQVTGIAEFDGIASVLIGCILGGTAIWLAVETKGLLIGESADQDTVDGIKKMVLKHPKIEHVNEVVTLHMGPDYILLNLSANFKNSMQAGELEKTIEQLTKEIKTKFPKIQRVFIEAEAKPILNR